MQINADRAVRVRLDTRSMPWVASPSAGVERRMLERDGDEVARATSLVRFAPGSAFPEHEHGAGEEFLVLDGVFSDEEGDFAAGWYVRNPPGSRHSPASGPGCTIFVKLRQMRPDDRASVRIDTRSAPAEAVGRGVGAIPLFTDDVERVRILILDPGASWAADDRAGGLEMLVLEGEVTADGEACPGGTWLRSPAARPVVLESARGCRIFVKTGHLAGSAGADAASAA